MQVFKQGGRSLIHLGESDVEYHPSFQLYMTSPLANPHYLPEVCIKVTLVNFTVTGQGLQEQLLAQVVRKERPDLEASKDRLLLSISNDKRQLKVAALMLSHASTMHLPQYHVYRLDEATSNDKCQLVIPFVAS